MRLKWYCDSTRYQSRLCLLVLACLWVFRPAWAAESEPAPKRPNILLLMTDNQRSSALGCAGNTIIQTPNIDRLAAEGVRFENAFCTTSICAASRASIFTGQYRRTHGYTFNTPPLSRQAMQNSYPALLRAAGYRTGFVGKFGIGAQDGAADQMFDFFRRAIACDTRSPYYRKVDDGTRKHLTRINGDRAIAFLRSCRDDKPFCLSVSFSAPHPEDDNPQQYVYDRVYQDLYADVTIPPPSVSHPRYFERLPDFIKNSMNRHRWFRRFDTPEKYQEMIKSMYRMITGVDAQVGRIMAELERLGLHENTVVIFTSDNGIMVGEHGLTGIWLMYEGSIRVPLVIYDPRLGAPRRAAQVAQMALNIDLPATMLDLAGLEIPRGMQGRSLLPLLRGEPVRWRNDFFYEHLFQDGGKTIPGSEGVRSERWKYVRYFRRKPVYEQLFDLKSDPDEINNLRGDQRHQKTLESLRRRCDKLRPSVDGP